jgi:hypothetical protein
MATLTYNGTTISDIQTKSVAYRDIMDEASGQDYVATEITIEVGGFVFAAGSKSAARSFAEIQHALEVPRKRLLFETSDVLVEADADTDVKNGPFPKLVGINRIDDLAAIYVSFQVVTYRFECPNNPDNRPAIVSNRWTEEEQRDKNYTGKRTRTGYVEILGGDSGVDLNQLKFAVLPAPPKGSWVRDKVVFRVDPSGLKLSYTVEESEVVQLPPYPAVEADGEYVEMRPNPGVLRYGTASIRLRGTYQESSTRRLVITAVALVTRRLILAGAKPDKLSKGYGIETSIRHQYSTNTVTVSARCLLGNYEAIEKIEDRYRHFQTQPWDVAAVGQPSFGLSSAGLILQSASPNNHPCPSSGNANLKEVSDVVKLEKQQGRPDTPSEEYVRQRLLSQNGGDYQYASRPVPTNYEYYSTTLDPQQRSDVPSTPPGGAYQNYEVRMRFVRDEGIAEMPGTLASSAVAFVNFRQPTTKLIVEWVAEREGDPPVLPPATLVADCGPVLLKSEISPGMIDVQAGGAFFYSVAGSYTYGFKYPDAVVINAAVPPWARDLETAAGTVAGGLGSVIVASFLDVAASQAVSSFSDRIISVGPATDLSTSSPMPAVPPPPNA